MNANYQWMRGLLFAVGSFYQKNQIYNWFGCALMFCWLVFFSAMAEAVEPLHMEFNKVDFLKAPLLAEVAYKNKATVHLKVIPGTAPLAVKLQTNVVGPAGTNADTYFLNVLIDADRDGQLRSFKPGLEEWLVHNIPVVVTEGQTSIVSAPEFHLGLHDIQLGPEPLHMRITLTPAPMTELYWDGYQYLEAGVYQDHRIEWPLLVDRPVLPVLMQCPNTIDFAGLNQVSFNCYLSAYNETLLNVDYALNRISGDVDVDNNVNLSGQVQLQSNNILTINAVDQPSVANVEFTAYRSGVGPSQWHYQANFSQPYARLSSTDVLLEFDNTVGDIVFVDSGLKTIALEPLLGLQYSESPLLLQGVTSPLAKPALDAQYFYAGVNGPEYPSTTVDDKEGQSEQTNEDEMATVIEDPLTTPPTFFTVPDLIENALCVVNKAALRYSGAQTIKPKIEFPTWATPLPGAPGSIAPPARTTGPVRGVVDKSVIDKSRAGLYLLGNAFEYQAMLNNRHGCSSQQYKRVASFAVDLSNNEINEIDKDTVGVLEKTVDGKEKIVKKEIVASGLGSGWHHDGRKYAGSTYTGYYPKAPFKHYYEGTPAMIRWVDVPHIAYQVAKPQNVAHINYGTLSSITWNSGRQKGWYCHSAHMMVYDARTQKAMSPADVNALFGQLKISAALTEEDKKHAGFLQKTQMQLKKNAVFTHNPLFIDLGCKAF